MVDCLSTGSAPADCDAAPFVQPGTSELEADWASLPKWDNRVHVVDLDDLVCEPTICHSEQDGTITFRDENHLTEEFAATLVDDLLQRMKEAGAPVRTNADGTS